MQPPRKSRADLPPRKVVIGTAMCSFRGSLSERLAGADRLIDEMAREAAAKYPGGGLDLVVLPEQALQNGDDGTAKSRGVPLEGTILDTMSEKARRYRTYIIVPMTLAETNDDKGKAAHVCSNAAALLNREGAVAGIYRKVHPVEDPDGTLEGGITAGEEIPVFPCDFGKLGIQICWDMVFEEGWLELSRKEAEIVAVPSLSPQTMRISSYAERGNYHVVTSTPRDNASIFNPCGLLAAEMVATGVLVHEVDLSYARLGWTANLKNGRALEERFGNRVGYLYSEREDAGLFWSNDPKTTIGSMIRELGLRELDERIDRARERKGSTRRSDS